MATLQTEPDVLNEEFSPCLTTTTVPIPEEDSLVSEGFQGDRIQVAVRLRPLQKTTQKKVDPIFLRGSPPRATPADCLTRSGILLPVRRINAGPHLDEISAWSIQGNDTIVQKGPGRKTPKKNLFTMDSVFAERAETKAIYQEMAKPIIQSVLAGRHGTIFAYGQTGSGKTYTMQGGNDIVDANDGLIQLGLHDLFEAIKLGTSRDWEVKVQYFEIYCEEVRDLLAAPAPETPPRRASSATLRRKSSVTLPASSLTNKKRQRASSMYNFSDNSSVNSEEGSGNQNLVRLPTLKVLEDRSGNVVVNAREKKVTTAEECLALLRKGNFNRASAATNANEHSSRSHAIFRVTLHSRAKNTFDGCGANVEETTARVSVLNLVDLAGSENCSRVALQGSVANAQTRKREGGKINQSLLSLSRCIHALSLNEDERPNHISFRDSKLTRILQPSLSGNACMAILCCCSMAKSDLEETRSTLKFASNAKNIQIKPVVNEIIDEKESFRRLQKELLLVKQTLLEFQRKFAASQQLPLDVINKIQLLNIPGQAASLEQQQQITAQPVMVGRITHNSVAKSTASDINSSMGSEDTPTMQPLVAKIKGMFCASPGAPPSVPEETEEEEADEEDTLHSGSSKPPVAEVEILDSSSATGEDEDHGSFQGSRGVAMDEQCANFLEERIQTTEEMVERMVRELNSSRHFMLEARAVNSELQDQVIQLRQELSDSDERSATPMVYSGGYLICCSMLYAFGLKDWFISAVIFSLLSLKASKQ